MADEDRKAGAPPVGLWLRLGPDLALEVLVRDLNQIAYVINRSDYERNMHTVEIAGDVQDETFREAAAALFTMAKSKGMATIFRGAPEAAKALGAEGVLLDNIEDMQAAKEQFGDDGIIGIACGFSQETSLAAYDAGADFVTFGTREKMPSTDVMKMWVILTDKPAVVEGPVTNDYVSYYVGAGAGFLDAGDYIWAHAKGVMQGTVNMLHAVDLALAEKDAKQDTAQ